MSAHFNDDQGEIRYREWLSPWARWLVAVIGMSMLVIPWIVVHQFTRDAGIINLLLISAGILLPVLASIFFVGLALSGTKQLRFDSTHRTVHLSTAGPLWRREKQIDYRNIESIDVLRCEGLDDPAHFVLLFKTSTHRTLVLGSFATASDAEYWQQRLMTEIHQPASNASPGHRD